MTHRAGPEQLVAVLDEYIEGMAAIVMKHGGMVDKIVGDSVHAFFNAPLDLSGHPQHAVSCAEEMREWSWAFQAPGEPSQIGFGRTRIGIETGMAIVGDIGIRSKLDYTAHGDSINSAARLEALNKRYGSTICVGPFAASRCTSSRFRPLGVTSLRGLDVPVEVFEPWPPGASQAWCERYVAAYRLIESDRSAAARLFEDLAQGVSRRSRAAVACGRIARRARRRNIASLHESGAAQGALARPPARMAAMAGLPSASSAAMRARAHR